MNCYLETSMFRKEWGGLHWKLSGHRCRQTGTLASHVVSSFSVFFFFFLREELFLGQGISIFFLYSASATFIPPEGFSHLPQENYFSPQKAQNSEWPTVHLFTGHIYWASGCAGLSTSAGDTAWTGYIPGFRELCPLIGSGPGSMRPKSAGCEGSGSRVCHLPSPLELETGVYSQGSEARGTDLLPWSLGWRWWFRPGFHWIDLPNPNEA